MSLNTHHIIEIKEKGITKYIPKELAHCNPTEFKDIARLLFNWQSGSISYGDFRVQAIYVLLKLKKGKRKINELEIDIAFSNIERVSVLMDSFFQITDTLDKRIKLNITDNPVPFVKPVFLRIHGPKPRLTNTNFGQYEDASNSYHMYYRTHDTKYLYLLFATYYQDPRRYNNDQTESKATYFKKTIDFANVFSFFLFFEAFQNYVTSSKVMWEGNVIDLSILFSKVDESEKSELPGLGTKSLAFQIAESGVFGNLRELRSDKLWEVLLRLYDIRKRDLDNKAEQERNAKKNA